MSDRDQWRDAETESVRGPGVCYGWFARAALSRRSESSAAVARRPGSSLCVCLTDPKSAALYVCPKSQIFSHQQHSVFCAKRSAGQTSSKMSDALFIKRAFEHAYRPQTTHLYRTTHMFCSHCHRQSQQDCKHFLGRRRRQSAVLLHWRLTFDAVESEREQISKIRAQLYLRNDETCSAIAGRTDEREACEQEVSGQKVGHTLCPGPLYCEVMSPPGAPGGRGEARGVPHLGPAFLG